MISTLPPPRSKQSAGGGLEDDAGPDRGEDEAGLLVAVDDLDLDAGLGLDAVDELAAVRGGADRAGGLGDDLPRAERVGELAQAPDRGDRAVGGGRRDAAVAGDVVAEAQHLLLPGDRGERAVEVHVGDEEVEGVRSEVERGDAHRTATLPTRVPWSDHRVEGNRDNGH